MTSREWSTRALLVTVSTVVSVLLLEGVCRTYVRVFMAEMALTRDRLRTTPPPYQHADYFTPEFIEEQPSAISQIPAASGRYFLLEDSAGRYITVVNGLRRTTNQPQYSERRLLVFGGSTVLSQDVPDEYTIPSFLQRMINASCETSVLVANYGVGWVTARQQRASLLEAGVQPNDIVVFYDGVNDVYYTVFAGGKWLDAPSDLVDRFFAALQRSATVSAIALVIVDARLRTVPRTVADAAILRRSLARAEAEYEHELDEAHRFVQARHGEFVHFLQPHLFATPLSTTYRREAARNYELTPPGLDIAFRLGYPRLREALEKVKQSGVESFDLSGLLAADRVPSEVFLDFAHVNDVANEMIAHAMFPSIADRIGDCDAIAGEHTPRLP